MELFGNDATLFTHIKFKIILNILLFHLILFFILLITFFAYGSICSSRYLFHIAVYAFRVDAQISKSLKKYFLRPFDMGLNQVMPIDHFTLHIPFEVISIPDYEL